MVPAAYRSLLQDRRTRLLLTGLGASSLGDGLSTVTIAWLAVRSLGASGTLAVSGLATLLLAAFASVLWRGERAGTPSSAT